MISWDNEFVQIGVTCLNTRDMVSIQAFTVEDRNGGRVNRLNIVWHDRRGNTNDLYTPWFNEKDLKIHRSDAISLCNYLEKVAEDVKHEK